MLSGDRRGPSVRRGMTVLGRIPAVPKPINLPSQRLENRGLDPNVEIVPRGGVSWGATGRSPPTINNAWGTATQASSPPLTNGSWGATAKQGSNVGSSGAAWGGAVSRPSSAGSVTRPSSAGSIGQMHDSQLTQNAWGPLPSRPASASGTSRSAAVSGVQGHGQGMLHSQPQTQPSFQRPRSAEERHAQVSRPGESTNFPVNAPGPAWGGAGAETKMARDSHQATAFQLTRLDFPTLGSEKSPDLRPQQGTATAERAVDEKLFSSQQQRPLSLSGPYDDGPRGSGPAFSNQERPVLDTWRREAFGGMPPGAEGNWHREEHRHLASHDGHPPVVDSWRRDGGHEVSPGASPDENWRRGGPPVGPHGPHGPPRFQLDSSGFPPQQRYGPGPGPGGYGRGPGGFGPHVGNVYGNAGLLSRQGGAGRPGPPLGPGMYPGPPYDGAYGPPGPMDERGMMMGGMVMGGPGMYVGFPNRQGPPPDVFNHYHGSMGSGPRLPPNSRGMREHPELVGDEMHDIGSYKDGRSGPVQDAMGNRRLVGAQCDASRPGTQGAGVGPQHGLRDWGTSASEEPMDFSKPVFEEDASLEAAGAKKPGGVAAGAGGDAENEPVNRGNAAVRDSARADDLKARERDDDNASSKDSVGGRLSGRSGRRAGSHDNNGEGGRLHRNKEPTVKEVGFSSRDGEVDGFVSKNHSSRKNAVASDRGTVEVIAPRKELPAVKDRPASRDSSSALQKANVLKYQDNSSASTVAGGGPSRPGQHGGTGRSSTSGNAVVLVAESTLLPTIDSTGAGPVDAGSVLLEEKPKLLKRTSSGANDAGTSVDASGPEVAITSSKEPLVKEEGIHKAKVVHDVEKEWRPKAATSESKPDGVSASSAQVIKVPASAGSTSESVSSAAAQERIEPESDLSTTETYDYEAQRAKMKEIAHQRSLQLQKEEEERIKEQKAKAHAKLEELNRRAAGLTAPDSNLPDDLPKDVAGEIKREGDASGVLGQEALSSNQANRAAGSLGGGRSGRNEHGKRERGDRKGSGRLREDHRIHSDSRDLTKVKVNSNPGQVRTEPPLLPSPSENNPSLQSQVPVPTGSQRSNGVEQPSGSRLGSQPVQIPSKQQTSRHRGKHATMQLKHGKEIEVSEVTEEQAAVPEVVAVAADRNEGAGWSSGPTAGESVAVDSSSVSNPANRKKRNSRSSKSKQRADGVDGSAHVVHNSEHSDGADLIDTTKSQVLQQEMSSGEEARGISQESVKELSFQPLVIEFGDSDLLKDFGVQSASPLSNGDSAGRRPQRKQQPVKRLARERGVQDVRVGDKSHSSDGLIWAPVRAAPSIAVNGSKPVEELSSRPMNSEKGECPGTVHVVSSKPSEVESLKPVAKLRQDHVETGQSNASIRQPQHQAGDVAVETRTVTGVGQAPVLPVAVEPIDSKLNDNFSRSARSHASWRQRGSGNERGPNAKYHYQQDSRVGGKDGSVTQPSQDFRSSMGKGGGSHAQLHEEPSSTHAQGDSGFKAQRADNHNSQAASRFPPQLNGQSAEQSVVQRPIPPDQQAKLSTSQQKLATVVAKTEQLSSFVDGGSSVFHSSQQSPIPAGREHRTYALVTPHHQPGNTNRAQVLSVTQEGEFQSDHAKPHRASVPHGEKRPPSSSERHQQRISGNQGPRVSDRELNGSRGVQQQPKPVSAHASRSRNFTSSSEYEKPSHGEQFGGYGDQPINERDRQREQQHVKVHAANNSSFRSVGHGLRGQVQGGDEPATALNGSSQGGRQQQGPSGSHDKEHPPHVVHQQFRAHQNFRQHGPMQDKDQPRDAAQHQRSGPSQAQWQQTSHEKSQSENRNYHQRSAAGRKNSQSSSDVEHHSDASKMSLKQGPSVNDYQSSPSQAAGQQKVSQDRRQPSSVTGTQAPQNSDSNLHWVGDSGGFPFVRGRDHGQSRRGRVVSRGGGSGGVKAGIELEGKTEHAGPKRMVIDATGGAVPNLVAG